MEILFEEPVMDAAWVLFSTLSLEVEAPQEKNELSTSKKPMPLSRSSMIKF
jgi:hypothetical protein